MSDFSQNQNPVIVTGSSAGGLSALKKFLSGFAGIPEKPAIIIAQHLSPERESKMAELLSSHVSVKLISSDCKIDAGFIGMPAPGYDVELEWDGKDLYARMKKPAHDNRPVPSIDRLFVSAAKSLKSEVTGIIMTGQGRDGSKGLRSIQNAGGRCLVQEISSAEYPSMPKAALQETGCKEYDLTSIGPEIFGPGGVDREKPAVKLNDSSATMFSSTPDTDFYSTIKDLFRERIRQLSSGSALRIWNPRCGSGSYAVFMALAVKKIQAELQDQRPVQVFATDSDRDIIVEARRTIISEEFEKGIEKADPALLQYITEGQVFKEVSSEIRSFLLFSTHELKNHPPFLKLDFIVLKKWPEDDYLNKDRFLHSLLYSALKKDGILFITEPPQEPPHFFTGCKEKGVYKKSEEIIPDEKIIEKIRPARQKQHSKTLGDHVRDTIVHFMRGPYAVIDHFNRVLELDGEIDSILSLRQGPVNFNIMQMIHPDLKTDLQTTLHRAKKEDRQCESRLVNFPEMDSQVRIRVMPLVGEKAPNSHYVIMFELRPGSGLIASDQNDREQIDDLERELNATREQLQTMIEELETSNEELQATNEELTITNQDYHAANQALETANSELQSTVQELQAAYSELKQANKNLELQTAALKESDAKSQALLENRLFAVILLDESGKITAFNQIAESMFSDLFSRSLIIGHAFSRYIQTDFMERFPAEFKSARDGKPATGETSYKDGNTRKHWIYNISPVIVEGHILFTSIGFADISNLRESQRKVVQQQELLESLFEVNPLPVLLLEERESGFCILEMNRATREKFGIDLPEQIIPDSLEDVITDDTALNTIRSICISSVESTGGRSDRLDFRGRTYICHAGFIGLNRHNRQFSLMMDDITESEKQRVALAESELLHRSVLQSMREGVVVQNADGKIIAVNRMAEYLLNEPEDKLKGQTSESRAPMTIREDGSPFPGSEHPAMVSLRTGEPVENVIMGLKFESVGRTVWIQINAQPLIQNGDVINGVVTTFTDITEQQDNINRIHLHRKSLNALAQSTHSLLSITDFNSAVKSALSHIRTAMNASRAFLFKGEYKDSDLLISPLIDDVAEGTISGIESGELTPTALRKNGLYWTFEKLISGIPILSHIEEMPGPERELFEKFDVQTQLLVPIFVDGTVGAVLGLNQCYEKVNWNEEQIDTIKSLANTIAAAMERYASEKEAEEQRLRTVRILESAPIVITLAELTGGSLMIRQINSALKDYFELNPESFTNHPDSVLTPEKQNQELRLGAALESQKTGKPVSVRYRSILGGQGKESLISATFGYIGLSDDEHPLFAITMIDLTEDEETQKQLIEAKKMQAIGQFTGSIAHDLNNMLQPVLVMGELVKSDLESRNSESDEENIRNLSIALEGANQSRNLITELLEYGRSDKKSGPPALLIKSIREQLETLKTSLDQGVSLNMETDTTDAYTNLDQSGIQRVITNLVKNASYSMRESPGRILIFIGRRLLTTPAGNYMGPAAGEYFEVIVSDEGPGIPHDSIEHIFEPFFTTKKSGEGTGLGLSIVYNLMVKSGGGITVQSMPGMGTTFILLFPVVSAEKTASPAKAPAKHGKLNMLIIDDDHAAGISIQKAIEKTGHSARLIQNPLTAEKHISDYPDYYDAVILDQKMPGITGLELAPKIKRISDIPVILCSGNVSEYSDRLAGNGINAAINKPVNIAELITIVSKF